MENRYLNIFYTIPNYQAKIIRYLIDTWKYQAFGHSPHANQFYYPAIQ